MNFNEIFKSWIQNIDSRFRLVEMLAENHYVEDWLAARCESEKTVTGYRASLRVFSEFVGQRGRDLCGIVEEWRGVKRLSEDDRERFIDDWSDLVRVFHTVIKQNHAPLTVKNFLVTIRSFFRFWKIPIDVELPRRACVVYHNRDLTRDNIKQILTFATTRDRVVWLVMAESGMRANSAVNLKFWQIREDFEAERVPMRVLLPSSSLKDHVGDRWTFIGEDGFRELKEYLKPRMPLKDGDFVFASEKKGKVKGQQFSVASLSVKFNRVVQKLGLDRSNGHKPKGLRMHGLRKYFRNNMKAEESLRQFWMGHSLGVDAHYITREVEKHREEYARGYVHLKVFESSVDSLVEFRDQLKSKAADMETLKDKIRLLENQLQAVRGILNGLVMGKGAIVQVEGEQKYYYITQEDFARMMRERESKNTKCNAKLETLEDNR